MISGILCRSSCGLYMLLLLAATPQPVIAQTQDAEAGQWQAVLQGNRAADFADYLARYPRGKYAVLAGKMLRHRQQAAATQDEMTVEYPQLEEDAEMDAEILYASAGRGRGNCSACHAIPAEPDIVSGDVGPPMIGMKQRFPDIEILKAAIADQKKFSPGTSMPPFGRNRILTPEQIDALAHYLYQY